MKALNIDDYLEALEKMKKSRRDRFGVLGELGVPGLAAVAGGFLAWLIGACTFVTVLGYTVLIVSNPIGWIVGGATVMGALGYFFTKLARSGGEYDTLKDLNVREIEQRIEQMRRVSKRSLRREPKMRQVISSLQLLVANGHLSQGESTDLIAAIEKRHVMIDVAFKQIQELARNPPRLSGPDRSGGLGAPAIGASR